MTMRSTGIPITKEVTATKVNEKIFSLAVLTLVTENKHGAKSLTKVRVEQKYKELLNYYNTLEV